MIKKIFLLTLFLLIIAVGLFYFNFEAKRTLITPFPYSFTPKAALEFAGELALAESSKILIVGDHMGANLEPFIPELKDSLALKFKDPPIIYNWSRAHEGLYRTLFKLSKLKKFPPIIVYHGASSEMYEKTFSVNDKNAILGNFTSYDDEKIISLIITFPWLSKIFYKRMHYYDLDEKKEYKNHLTDQRKLDEKEISFKLFDYQIKSLIELVKEKKSHLIMITTPLNLEIHPHETCSHSTNQTVINSQKEIEIMMKTGDLKSAFSLAFALSNDTYSNARTFYLLGKVNLGLGDLAEARSAFQKATVFDCDHWRGNAVYNAIMKSEAKAHQVMLIDFDQYMASQLSHEALFNDDFFPQNVFYQTMMSELLENLKKLLSVND
jgi:tetratricopeptide (TPR) repeat protein